MAQFCILLLGSKYLGWFGKFQTTYFCWENRSGSELRASMTPASSEEPGLASCHELGWFSVLLVFNTDKSLVANTMEHAATTLCERSYLWEGFPQAFTTDHVFAVQIWKVADHWTLSFSTHKVWIIKINFPGWRANSSPGPKIWGWKIIEKDSLSRCLRANIKVVVDREDDSHKSSQLEQAAVLHHGHQACMLGTSALTYHEH